MEDATLVKDLEDLVAELERVIALNPSVTLGAEVLVKYEMKALKEALQQAQGFDASMDVKSQLETGKQLLTYLLNLSMQLGESQAFSVRG